MLIDEFEHDPARGAFPGQEIPAHQPLSHLELVANADVYLIAPASANTLAKLAAGLADNLLTSCALAATCPIVVAPAMNNHMYEHPSTQANIEVLRARGVHVLEPGVGRLASRGEHGVGRLPEPERLLGACEEILAEGPWSGLRVLVTAGGTREPLDSVRFLGNSSSGRMGLALAEVAHGRGAEVTLVAANVALEPPAGVTVRPVSTAAELEQACEAEFPTCDILLMAAAVADFRRRPPGGDGKITKEGPRRRSRPQSSARPPTGRTQGLSSRRKPGQTLVAFAAEHGPSALEHARVKLSAKQVDAVVFNDISRSDIGFESAVNEVTIITSGGDEQVSRARKESVAATIIDAVDRLRTSA